MTATQILADHSIDIMRMDDDFNSQLLHAMERYAEQKSASLQSENESLKAALKELVEIEELKIKMSRTSTDLFWSLRDQYAMREPLAWEQARKLINPK